MSLINEALKKAQAQRQSATPPPGAPPPGEGPRLRPPGSSGGPTFWLVSLLIGGIVVIFVIGAGLIVWGLRGTEVPPPSPPPVAAQAGVVTPDSVDRVDETGSEIPPESTAADPEPANPPAREGAAAPEPEAEPNAPVTGENEGNPAPEAPAGEKEQATPESATHAASPEPNAEPADVPVAPTPQIDPDPNVQTYLALLEVRGVMSGGQKALIYNRSTERSRAYTAGATINNELQIRIQDITESSISFVDHDGYVYTKSF